MQIGPILRSMRHHKGAFSLLVLEVAFGYVILVHAIIAARYYGGLAAVDTGMPVDDIVMVHERFLQPRPISAARAVERADLAALARLDGTSSAAVDTAPLPNRSAARIRVSRIGVAPSWEAGASARPWPTTSFRPSASMTPRVA